MNKKQKQQLYELKKKSPGTAAVLSLLFTGLGQWYCGRIGRGFVMLFLQIFLWFLLLGWIMWIVAPIDAYGVAKETNRILALELGVDA